MRILKFLSTVIFVMSLAVPTFAQTSSSGASSGGAGGAGGGAGAGAGGGTAAGARCVNVDWGVTARGSRRAHAPVG